MQSTTEKQFDNVRKLFSGSADVGDAQQRGDSEGTEHAELLLPDIHEHVEQLEQVLLVAEAQTPAVAAQRTQDGLGRRERRRRTGRRRRLDARIRLVQC